MLRSIAGTSLRGLGIAVRTLTALPWPWGESEDFGLSLPWFSLVGLALGMIVYTLSLVWGMLPFGRWTAGAALILLMSDVCLTRGLHLDGLADWADSLGGFREKEGRLEIMKDVHLGSFGGLALILALLARWAVFERMLSSGSVLWVAAVYAISRDVMVALITTLPYARSGEGMARAFVDGASPRRRVVSHAVCLLVCIPFGPLGMAFFGLAGWMTLCFRGRYRRGFGGITGDLLGTANEVVEISLLFLCALPGERILDFTGWAWVV